MGKASILSIIGKSSGYYGRREGDYKSDTRKILVYWKIRMRKYGVVEICLELQRGQVGINKKR